MKIVANSGEVDLLLMHMPFAVPSSVDSEWRRVHRETVVETRRALDIPIAVVQPHSSTPESSAVFSALQRKCIEAGIPLYSTTTQAAGAISRFIQYHKWKSRE
jgi:acyl-CoA synthetase (NDP forming)